MQADIESLAQFDDAVAAGHDLARAVVQSVDLSQRTEALRGCRVDGALFLGCRLEEAAERDVRARGALVFPRMPEVPLDVYRASLYAPQDLYDTLTAGTYEESLDARAYAWTRAAGPAPSLDVTLAAALHDHAMTDALDEYLATVSNHRVVGIMGGHALERGSDGYAATARLAMALTNRGCVVASGGGPGAMEAANLGAWLAPHGEDALGPALEILAEVPSFRPSIDAWARSALAVLERFPGGAPSIGIPTWFYGHEPPNLFASHIAKYCSNAQREDVLLQRCKGGLVYLAGAAGTTQELFQAVTGNYYAADPATLTPLVLVGVQQWTETLPAWPLLAKLASGKPMEAQIKLVDSVEEAGAWLTAGRDL